MTTRVGLLWCAILLGACAQEQQSSSPVVDAPLLAYLSKARAVHLQADIAEGDKHPDEAIALLQSLVASRAPGVQPEVREVLADTLARLAELKSARKDFDGAKADVRRGLDLALEHTYFRGRLFEVLGGVEKSGYEQLRDKGDEPGAHAAKERSIAALKEAVAIHEEVIERALGR